MRTGIRTRAWKLGGVARVRALACGYPLLGELLSPPVVVKPKAT